MFMHRAFNIPLQGGVLPLGPSPLIMGILNITPDSFSDGGDFISPKSALAQAKLMLEQGAAIIDIGGQSTRPGAVEISSQEETNRVIPVIKYLISEGIKAPISIDTFKAEIAEKAISAGATIINDVTGLHRDPEIAAVAAQSNAPLVAMHWDKNRAGNQDLLGEVKRFFAKSLAIASDAGVNNASLILDPGFGFAKNLTENYQLLNRLEELHDLNLPLLIGTSRKSMLGKVLDTPPKERITATAATSVIAYQKGAHIFRVHDVAPNLQALQIAQATCYGAPQQED